MICAEGSSESLCFRWRCLSGCMALVHDTVEVLIVNTYRHLRVVHMVLMA